MSSSSHHKSKAFRMGLPLLLIWSIAWLLGIFSLTKVAIDLRAQLKQTNLDTELALYANSIYGLTWFDNQGKFHKEILAMEPSMEDIPHDIWVIEPGSPHKFHISPEKQRFALSDFSDLIPDVMVKAQQVYKNGVDTNQRPYRLLAIPTYSDSIFATRPRAMIIVVANPQPGEAAYNDFVRNIGATAIILGLIGIGLGFILTRISLRPVYKSLHQRERFLSATAHELRTPLTALQNISETALNEAVSPEQSLKRISIVVEETNRTVENLLMFARLDAGLALERQEVRLDLLIETLLPDESDIEFKGRPHVVDVDPRLVSVAIRNLLENAQKYSGKSDSDIQISVEKTKIVVQDNGPGFPDELLGIKEHDFPISPSQGGTGLGLAIVSLVAHLHGGLLELENVNPHGGRAIFHFS